MIVKPVICAIVVMSLVSVQAVPMKIAEKSAPYTRVLSHSPSAFHHMGDVITRWKSAKHRLNSEIEYTKKTLEMASASKIQPDLYRLHRGDNRAALEHAHDGTLGFDELFSGEHGFDLYGRRRMSALTRAERARHTRQNVEILYQGDHSHWDKVANSIPNTLVETGKTYQEASKTKKDLYDKLNLRIQGAKSVKMRESKVRESLGESSKAAKK